MKQVNKTVTVDVTDSKNYFLDVLVGNGMIGGNALVTKDSAGNIIDSKKVESLKNFFIGTGKYLKALTDAKKKFEVRTVVLDVNPYTDLTVITHRLKDDAVFVSPTPVSFSQTADAADHLALYVIEYVFK